MSKLAPKKVAADAAPAIPAGNRLAIDPPAFGNLSAKNQKRIDEYLALVRAELAIEAELRGDRAKLLAEGYDTPVSAVIDRGRELLAKHALLATRQADLFRDKLRLSAELEPDFKRISNELTTAYEETVNGLLAQLRSEGVDGSQWGTPSIPGVQRRLRQFAEEKEPAMAALGRLKTVNAQLEAIATWAELAERPQMSAMQIRWPTPQNERELIVAKLAGVTAAPQYPPIRVNPETPPHHNMGPGFTPRPNY